MVDSSYLPISVDKSVRTQGASEPQSTNHQMNYPWYMGIPRQGIKAASSGLPDIQTDKILPFTKNTILGNPQPSPNYFIFSKIFGERKKAVCLRRLHEPKLRRHGNKP